MAESYVSADLAARQLVLLAGPRDAWLLADDGVSDATAIRTAANGMRPVRLTACERAAAALVILASGGTIQSVCLRLNLAEGTESKYDQLRKVIHHASSTPLLPPPVPVHLPGDSGPIPGVDHLRRGRGRA